MSEWKKVRLGDVCKIEKGSTGIASAIPGEYPLVVTAAERKTSDSYQFDCAAVCIPLVSSKGHGVKALNHVHYQNGKFALGSILCAVIPKNEEELDARYLHQYLQFYKDSLLVRLMKGAANVSLSMKDIATVEVPLPPINKQKELAEMFVKLQEKSVRIQEEFEKEKNYIKQLRQNILQDAIEGKLTEDWRCEQLYSNTKNDNAYSSLRDKDFFRIPDSWMWTKIGELGEISRGSGITRADIVKNGYPCVRYGELYTTYGLHFSETISYITKAQFDSCRKFKRNAVVFTLTGENRDDIAKASAYLGDESVAASGDLGFWSEHGQNPQYLSYLMASRYFKNVKKQIATGDFIIHISTKKIKEVLIPIPTIEEQNEIVSRMEKMLSQVDELDKEILNRETLAKQLTQSILKDAFEN